MVRNEGEFFRGKVWYYQYMPEGSNPEATQIAANSPEAQKPDNKIFLLRGLKGRQKGDQVGVWWTTNPRIALGKAYEKYRRGVGSRGDVFVAQVSVDELASLTEEGSLDKEFKRAPHGLRLKEDPPNLRKVTKEELDGLELLVSKSPREAAPEDIRARVSEIFTDNNSSTIQR